MSEFKLPSPEDWFDDEHSVQHAAQGDIFGWVPFPLDAGADPPRGASKKPAPVTPSDGPVVLVTYTCQLVAQPPGTSGYSHPFRQVAPVRPLSALMDRKRGLKAGIADKIVSGNRVEGYCYLPIRPEWGFDDSGKYEGHGAALLYAMFTVTQDALDATDRIARLSEDGQRILASRSMRMFSPMSVTPWQSEMAPDRTDSWTVAESA